MLAEHFFHKAVDHTRLSAQSVAIAHKVLVKGWDQADAAKLYGVTQPRVSAICAVVLRARASRELPKDWVKVAVTVPEPLAKAMRQAAREAKRELEAERKAAWRAAQQARTHNQEGSNP